MLGEESQRCSFLCKLRRLVKVYTIEHYSWSLTPECCLSAAIFCRNISEGIIKGLVDKGLLCSFIRVACGPQMESAKAVYRDFTELFLSSKLNGQEINLKHLK